MPWLGKFNPLKIYNNTPGTIISPLFIITIYIHFNTTPFAFEFRIVTSLRQYCQYSKSCIFGMKIFSKNVQLKLYFSKKVVLADFNSQSLSTSFPSSRRRALRNSRLGFSRGAMNLLIKYHYPGNIRELENIIERAVILARGEVLTLQDLPVFVKQQNGSDSDLDVVLNENEGQLTLPEILALTEKRVIMKALEKHQQNQSKAAKALGISESGLRYKIQSLKIPKE